MANSVTVPGAHGSTATLVYDSSANALLAQYVASAIQAGLHTAISVADSASGSPPPLFGTVGEWEQDTSGTVTIPKGYDYLVDAAPASTLVDQNRDPNQQLLAGADPFIFNASGSGSVVAGLGNDAVIIPASDAGAWFIAMGNGIDTIKALGAGNDTISVGSGMDSIQLGSGSDLVTTGGSATITAGSGSETVTGYGSDVIYGMSSHLTFAAGGGATVFGGTGSDSVTGGSGPDVFYGGSGGNNSLTAGTGAATLFGGGNNDQLFANGAGAQILYAGSGNETLTGSSATGAQDTFAGGSGAATVNASPSATQNMFEFISGAGPGTEVVTGLSLSSQVSIHLAGYGGGEESNAITTQTNSGGSTTLQLTDGTAVTFQNVSTITTLNFS